MRVSHLLGLLAFTLLGACAQLPTQDDAGGVTAVVLPDASDGHVGAVAVRPRGGGEPVLLDQAYATASFSAGNEVRTSTMAKRRANAMFAASRDALPRPPVRFQVYFVEGTDELNPAADRAINGVVAEAASRPSPEISVIGHTDFIGSDEFNDRLSLQRAQRVRDLLIQRRIPREYIQVAGRGKREPLIDAPENVPEPRNRRVEISVR
jgi:outer membrane protein OmpA-like peptidoglycan-associated protein